MDYVLIGKIVNTRGIKGELKLKSLTDFPEERFKINNDVYIKTDNDFDKMRIIRYNRHKNMDYIVLEGMEDINLVEKYKGCEVYADKNDELNLSEDEFYAEDLIGLKVYQENQLKGEIVEVKSFPQGDYIDVLKPDGKHALVPFRMEFILNVDFESARVEVIDMEGLL